MSITGRTRYAILDRDGTLIVLKNYLSDPDEVVLLPGVLEGLHQLRAMGLGLIVITNQSGVGRGHFDEARLAEIHARLSELLVDSGIQLDGIYYCPHTPEESCTCRKPNPGLIQMAARKLDFDPSECYVIGDNISDIELGQRVRATTFLIRTGYGAQVESQGDATPDYVQDDLVAVSRTIGTLLMSSQGKS